MLEICVNISSGVKKMCLNSVVLLGIKAMIVVKIMWSLPKKKSCPSKGEVKVGVGAYKLNSVSSLIGSGYQFKLNGEKNRVG